MAHLFTIRLDSIQIARCTGAVINDMVTETDCAIYLNKDEGKLVFSYGPGQHYLTTNILLTIADAIKKHGL